MVAREIRAEIVSGRLRDGDSLPNQSALMERFGVSLKSLREGLQILESEGLIRVRRGISGGAVVQAPSAHAVANAMATVLEHRHASFADLCLALLELEPPCAAMCANRMDRGTVVIPRLLASVAVQEAALDDSSSFVKESNNFHRILSATCGNETLRLIGGALESIWAIHNHEAGVAIAATNRSLQLRMLREHKRLIAIIEAGNATVAARHSRRHLQGIQDLLLSATTGVRVNGELLRQAAAMQPDHH